MTDEVFGSTGREEGKGNALGFHGFVGTEILLGKNFSLSLEAFYRVARIPSLECTSSENTTLSTVGDPVKRVVNYDT